MIQKYKKLSNGVKASLWFMFCNIIQKGIAFITVPIFTRLLTSSQYGEYSLFLSWQEVVSIFATLNLNYQVFNNGMIKYKNDKDGYTMSMVGLGLISSLIVFALIMIAFPLWYKFTNINIMSVCLMFINMYFLLVMGLWTVRNRFDYKYKMLTLLTILMAIANPILGIIFVKVSSQKVLARILSTALVSAVFGIICFGFLLKKSKKVFNIGYWKYALKIDLPLIPHYISMVILHSSDRIMIGYLVNSSATAFYSVSYNVALIMQIVLNSINASFIPWVYQKLESRDYDKIRSFSLYLVGIVAILCSLPMFFAPEAVSILGGSQYIDAASVIPVLSTSVFMIFFYSMFIIIEMYFEKGIYTTVGSVSAAIINIILNLIFIRIFGYKAAAYTTLSSYMVLALFHYIICKKILYSNDIKEQVFDIKKMSLIALILFGLSMLITLIYKYFILRYLILGVIVITAILNRNKLTGIISDLKRSKSVAKKNES